jgi:assimilatory nitrate reductase catalytic subunit
MHWNDRFTTAGRVGALLEAHTDPVSGQPELKHAAVRLGRYAPAWHGFALTRAPFEFRDCTYVAAAKGDAHWRYELAGEALPRSWPEWAAPLLGKPEDRIELLDDSGGRYRAASVQAGRLTACVFVNRHRALPPRGWLASLFAADALDDDARLGLLAGRAAGAPDNGPVVCSCFAVGRSALLRAIRTQALVSPADVGRALGAGTNCGSCLPELKTLLAEAAAGP